MILEPKKKSILSAKRSNASNPRGQHPNFFGITADFNNSLFKTFFIKAFRGAILLTQTFDFFSNFRNSSEDSNAFPYNV